MTAEGEELPSPEDEEYQKIHTRGSCHYENRCQPFRNERREYATQYAHIYFTRLQVMRKELKKAAFKKWGTYYRITYILLDGTRVFKDWYLVCRRRRECEEAANRCGCGREVLYYWNSLQEDGTETKHLEGDQCQREEVERMATQALSNTRGAIISLCLLKRDTFYLLTPS